MVERELKHDRILINLRNDLAKSFSLDKATEYMKNSPKGEFAAISTMHWKPTMLKKS